MATFDGSDFDKVKEDKEREDGNSDMMDVYEDPDGEVCPMKITEPIPVDDGRDRYGPDMMKNSVDVRPKDSKMFEYTVSMDNPDFLRYRDTILARAEMIAGLDKKISYNEALKMARADVFNIATDPNLVASRNMMDRLSEQQNLMLKMAGRIESLEKGQGTGVTGGVSVREENMMAPSINSGAIRNDFITSRNDVREVPVSHGASQGIHVDRFQPHHVSSRISIPEPAAVLSVSRSSKYYSKPLVFASDGGRGNYRRKPMEIEKFAGTEKESWEAFLNQFMMVSDYNEWTEREACCHLQKYLTGKAKEFIFENPEDKIYGHFGELVDLLSVRFGCTDNFVNDAKTLRSRMKKKGESFKEMAQEINTIAGRLYRKDDVARSREAHQAFLRGLPDNFRMAAAAVNATNPEDLVKACVQMSAVLDMDERDVGISKGRVNNVASDGPDSSSSQRPSYPNNNNYSSNNNSQRSNYSGPRDLSKIQCWKCKEFGHFSRNCKVRVKCQKCGWNTHITEFCRIKTKPTDAGNEQKSQ
jgi:hypothetical protein